MYTFSPMMVANSRKHHCRVRPYTQEVLVISTNLDTQKNHNPLDFTNRRGDEARIKNTWSSSNHPLTAGNQSQQGVSNDVLGHQILILISSKSKIKMQSDLGKLFIGQGNHVGNNTNELLGHLGSFGFTVRPPGLVQLAQPNTTTGYPVAQPMNTGTAVLSGQPTTLAHAFNTKTLHDP
ncbi:hypothetical protein Tco_0729904 [Tanacetum coccineum]|uniref:Uncharacterized protein n=1 Tax=Tanacetum coccineum TaxID=301880 RepID=A0ABQ4YQ90_9ASTR